MPSLKDPYMKADRAKEHLDGLKVSIQRFLDSKPYAFSSYDDLETSQFVITVTCEPYPLNLCLIAGDFVSNLRSSLDHLAWQLAALTTAPAVPGNDVCFPIWGEYSTKAEAAIAKATKQIPAEATRVIKSLQPYNCGTAYVVSHLWRLHALWNMDKHRHIPAGASTTDTFFPGIRRTKSCVIEQLDDGGIIRMPLSEKPKVQLNPTWNVDVKFGSHDEGILVGVSDLVEIYEFVREKVIPRFSRFFPQFKAGGEP